MSKDAIKEFFKSFESADEKIDFHLAHENIDQDIPAITTGSLLLDDALGCGGLPLGRLIQLYGAPGSGKTLLSLLAIKNAQAMDPDSVQFFIDAEQTFSPQWAETLGCDTSRIVVIDGSTAVYGRDCFEMLLGVPKEDAKTHAYLGQSKDGLLDKIIKGEIKSNLIIYDSLGALIPPGEDVSRIGKMNMALMARFLTGTFRKLSLAVSKANVCFICINHIKATMDQYGPDHTFSGGNSYAHSLSANIFFTKVSRKDAQLLDDNEEVKGNIIRATIEKSKFSAWPRKCEFMIDFGEGIINQHEEIGLLALKYGVVKKPNNVSHEYGDLKWVGAAKFADAIKNDSELADKLKADIVEARKALRHKAVEEQEAKTAAVAEKAVRGRPKKVLKEVEE